MPNASLAGAHVLIIGTGQRTGGRLAEVVASLGGIVTWAATEQEALRDAASPETDLAIVDLGLGDQTALSIAGQLRSRCIPLIFCGESGHRYQTGPYRDVPVLSNRFTKADVAGALRAALRWGTEQGDPAGRIDPQDTSSSESRGDAS